MKQPGSLPSRSFSYSSFLPQMLGVDDSGEGFGGGTGKLPCLPLLEPQAPYRKIEDKTFIWRGGGRVIRYLHFRISVGILGSA